VGQSAYTKCLFPIMAQGNQYNSGFAKSHFMIAYPAPTPTPAAGFQRQLHCDLYDIAVIAENWLSCVGSDAHIMIFTTLQRYAQTGWNRIRNCRTYDSGSVTPVIVSGRMVPLTLCFLLPRNCKDIFSR